MNEKSKYFETLKDLFRVPGVVCTEARLNAFVPTLITEEEKRELLHRETGGD